MDYCGGFELEDLDQILEAVQSNYKAWCSGFAPLIVGGDMDSIAVQEFTRTLFNMRPDIPLSLAHTIFLSDSRHILGHVTTPCHIIHSIMLLCQSRCQNICFRILVLGQSWKSHP